MTFPVAEAAQSQPGVVGVSRGDSNPIDRSKALIGIYADQGLTSVGVAGFEPTASSSRTKRATKLRHTPRHAGQ
jgi:hypothetical protein